MPAYLCAFRRDGPGCPAVLKKRMAAALGEASQTEYVKIASSSKKQKGDVLTDRQEAVRAQQRAGLSPLLTHIGRSRTDKHRSVDNMYMESQLLDML
jgi:hypothetical protein